MRFLKFFIIISIFFTSVYSYQVECNENLRENRKQMRDILKLIGSIYFITDLTEINQDIWKNSFENKLLEHKFKNDFIYPPQFIQSYNSFTRFTILVPIGNKTFVFASENIKRSSIRRINKNFLSGDFCMEKSYQTEYYQLWQESNVTGCSLAMFVCHVAPTNLENKFSSTKEILILTKGEKVLGENEIKACFESKIYMNGLKFMEFKSKGLCICDDMDYYINDCENENGNFFENNDDDFTYIYGIVGTVGIFILILFIAAFYDCLIEN
ncbi:hypothetical protein PVAND_015837 [Polypedilum vanderplanki]|uniref:Uncharacterized protein n=1 Tax=Polypedilum vanderplanki TaxID=319348 RepID=A0A9J6BEB3_POLVA|nr:hypothetical protein PVAND_015837 [Polypedilum vanderplanki]